MKRRLRSYLIDWYNLAMLRLAVWAQWVRFGTIVEITKATDGGVVSEAACYDRWGRQVGYWAYGYYDPNQPYQGHPVRIWSTPD